MHRVLCLGILLPTLVLAAGCMRAPPLPKTHPSTGTVVYQGGEPVRGGSVQFNSPNDNLLRIIGQINDKGEFTLRTIKDIEAQGAPEGDYEVVVTPSVPGVDPNDVVAMQTKRAEPITLKDSVKVQAKTNTFKLELPIPSP
jgi:hypothetical protein